MANFDLDLTDNLDANIDLDDNTENFKVGFGEVYGIPENDFNKLENRPSYAGQTMTGDTSIPAVPTKVSDLENDSDYQTGSEVESAISEAVAGKQDKLTAGNNITIENNVISSSDTTYTAGNGLNLSNENEFSVDTTVVATQANLSAEVKNREDADTALQGQIDAISASSDVVDIVGTHAELEAYDTQHLKDNDIIKVLQDETQNNATTYYRWSTHTNTFTLIGQEGPYYTKAAADAQFVPQTRTVNSKALSSNITLTASDVSAVATGDVVQATGSNTTKVMSQKATTDALGLKLNISDYVVDTALANSTNPVQNKVLYGLFSSMPSDFFTGPVSVNGNGRDITLTGTMNTKLSGVKMYGDTTQQTYQGYNLIDLVPATNMVISASQQCSVETVMDNTLGKNVIHITATGNYPSIVYDFPVRLQSGKYYALKFTYKSAVTGGYGSMWFAPNPSTNNWDVLSSLYKDTRCKMGDGDTTVSANYNDVAQSTTWKTTSRRFYIDPSIYSAQATSYTKVCFSLGYGVSSTYNTSKELWLADAEIYEITQAEWDADSYTSKAYEPYVGGTPSPNPDYPQDVNVVTGTQTVTISDGNGTSASYNVHLIGKNLARNAYQSPVTSGGVTFTTNADGSISTSGTASANINFYLLGSGTTYHIDEGTYTLSTGGLDGDNSTYFVYIDGTGSVYWNSSSSSKITQTVPSGGISISPRIVVRSGTNMDGLTFKIQLEQGTATSYSSYYAPIELCKIGTYQDYIYKSGGDWYVHKEIRKTVFNGSESWNINSAWEGTNTAIFYLSTSVITANVPAICNSFTYYKNAYSTDINGQFGLVWSDSTYVFRISKTIASTTAAFQTWLSSNNMILYDILATPTDTKITNADLVSDLNALWNALSYDGQTNIAITGSGLSGLLDVTAYKKTLAGVIGAINRS